MHAHGINIGLPSSPSGATVCSYVSFQKGAVHRYVGVTSRSPHGTARKLCVRLHILRTV